MYRDIKKKILILRNRRPYQEETASYIEEMNRIDWVTSCLRLSGVSVSKEDVQKILKGELLTNISLKTHQMVHRYVAMMRHIEGMLEMELELSEKTLLLLYEELFEPEPDYDPELGSSLYRRNNPVILEWRYNPPHFNEIREQMELAFHWLGEEKRTLNPDMNPFLRGAILHNKLVEIYPFGESSPTMARVALLYELLAGGFPSMRISMSEQEYNCAIELYLKKEDSQPLAQAVETGIYNQLELMVQLTAIK